MWRARVRSCLKLFLKCTTLKRLSSPYEEPFDLDALIEHLPSSLEILDLTNTDFSVSDKAKAFPVQIRFFAFVMPSEGLDSNFYSKIKNVKQLGIYYKRSREPDIEKHSIDAIYRFLTDCTLSNLEHLGLDSCSLKKPLNNLLDQIVERKSNNHLPKLRSFEIFHSGIEREKQNLQNLSIERFNELDKAINGQQPWAIISYILELLHLRKRLTPEQKIGYYNSLFYEKLNELTKEKRELFLKEIAFPFGSEDVRQFKKKNQVASNWNEY